MSKKVAVVTGGVGGIGTEICRYLAKGGYSVAATCIASELDGLDSWKAQWSTEGLDIQVFQLEITDFDDCVRVTAEIEEKMGQNLSWERLDNRRACRISIKFEGPGLRDRDHWDEIQDKMIDTMIKLENVFKEHIKKLD